MTEPRNKIQESGSLTATSPIIARSTPSVSIADDPYTHTQPSVPFPGFPVHSVSRNSPLPVPDPVPQHRRPTTRALTQLRQPAERVPVPPNLSPQFHHIVNADPTHASGSDTPQSHLSQSSVIHSSPFTSSADHRSSTVGPSDQRTPTVTSNPSVPTPPNSFVFGGTSSAPYEIHGS